MKKRSFFVLLLFLGTSGLLHAQSKENAAFDKLKALTGDWEGTVAWTGKPASPITAHYSMTGNGSAVVENLSNNMTSVYHLDGANLRVTHYCAAGNQPRLRATSFGPDNSSVSFSFVDATNMSSPSAGHVDGIELKFLAPDHVTIQFHFVSGEKGNDELLDLRRKS